MITATEPLSDAQLVEIENHFRAYHYRPMQEMLASLVAEVRRHRAADVFGTGGAEDLRDRKLPVEIRVGAVKFRSGVPLGTVIDAIERHRTREGQGNG